jgi:hypothetical protein
MAKGMVTGPFVMGSGAWVVGPCGEVNLDPAAMQGHIA